MPVRASGTVNVNVPGTYTIGYSATDGNGNTATTTRPELEEPIAKGTRVRKPKARPMLRKQFDKPRIVSQHIDKPRFNLGKNSLVKVFDLENYGRMLANVRTFAQTFL